MKKNICILIMSFATWPLVSHALEPIKDQDCQDVMATADSKFASNWRCVSNPETDCLSTVSLSISHFNLGGTIHTDIGAPPLDRIPHLTFMYSYNGHFSIDSQEYLASNCVYQIHNDQIKGNVVVENWDIIELTSHEPIH